MKNVDNNIVMQLKSENNSIKKDPQIENLEYWYI